MIVLSSLAVCNKVDPTHIYNNQKIFLEYKEKKKQVQIISGLGDVCLWTMGVDIPWKWFYDYL